MGVYKNKKTNELHVVTELGQGDLTILPPGTDMRLVINNMLQALVFIHSMGVIHRDIKPENFIVSFDKKIKLIDFGISSVCSQNKTAVFKTNTLNRGVIPGTPQYSSPELLYNMKNNSASHDSWPLGLTIIQLFRLEEGYEKPWIGKDQRIFQILMIPLLMVGTSSVNKNGDPIYDEDWNYDTKKRELQTVMKRLFKNFGDIDVVFNAINNKYFNDNPVMQDIFKNQKERITAKDILESMKK